MAAFERRPTPSARRARRPRSRSGRPARIEAPGGCCHICAGARRRRCASTASIGGRSARARAEGLVGEGRGRQHQRTDALRHARPPARPRSRRRCGARPRAPARCRARPAARTATCAQRSMLGAQGGAAPNRRSPRCPSRSRGSAGRPAAAPRGTRPSCAASGAGAARPARSARRSWRSAPARRTGRRRRGGWPVRSWRALLAASRRPAAATGRRACSMPSVRSSTSPR